MSCSIRELLRISLAVLFGLPALGFWGWLILRQIMTESQREKFFGVLRKIEHGKEIS